MPNGTRPAEDINLNRNNQIKALTAPELETRLAETQKRISQRLAGAERAEIGVTAAQLEREGMGRGLVTPLIRGQQEKLARQRAIERQAEAAELAPLQRQEAALLGRLGREEAREAREFQQAQQLGAAERAERGLEFQLRAPERAITAERRAEERGIRAEERGAIQRQQQFEQQLGLQGFQKVASPEELQGLTEDQITRIPNPQTGQIDIFKKPIDDDLLSISELKELNAQGANLQFGATVKQAIAKGVTPRLTKSGTSSSSFIIPQITNPPIEEAPSFDEFIAQKEAELQQTLLPSGREEFRDEFNQLIENVAKEKADEELSIVEQLSPLTRSIYKNPAVIEQITATERGKALAELEAAGISDLESIGLKREDKLRTEFTNRSKEFVKIKDSIARVRASGKDPSAAGDLSLIFNFMKVLDPASVVRESEFATAQNAGSIPDRTRGLYNRVVSGERLSPRQRQDFLNRAELLFNEKLEAHKGIEKEYTDLAKRQKLNVDNIIIDFKGKTPEIEQPTELPTGTAEDILRKHNI